MSFYSNLPPAQNVSNNLGDLYPTLFEIISSQEIDDLLPASLRYILTKYWISRYPTKFSIGINNYFDEWFNILLKGSVEWYHLNQFNATFVDKFYGLQKFDNSNKERSQTYIRLINEGKLSEWPKHLRLQKKQRLVIWLQKIILPYLVTKLDDWLKKCTAQLQFQGTETTLKKWFIKIYPILKKIGFILDLFTKLTFIRGTHGSTTFLDYLFKIDYTRTMVPLKNLQNKTQYHAILSNKKVSLNKFKILGNIENLLTKILNILSFTGSQIFPTSMFMLKVYQWWMSQDLTAKLQKRINNIDSDIPRPPFNTDQHDITNEDCIICKQKIQNPAVIESGYVMCYPCAVDYLKNNDGKCPVTNQKLLNCKYDSTSDEWDVMNSVRKLLI